MDKVPTNSQVSFSSCKKLNTLLIFKTQKNTYAFLMRYFLFLLLLPSLLLRASADIFFSEEEDPSLCNHVNIISGHLNLSFQDALIPSASPFTLSRAYSSSGALERNKDDTDLL